METSARRTRYIVGPVEENLQTGGKLRPVDLARAHGLSTQAVRNYEEAGVLPPAARGENGYRAYTPGHALALAAFLALVPGHGHATATAVMRAVNRGACDEAFRLIDLSHAQLAEDRRTLEAVERALRDLAPAPGTTTTTPTATDPPGATGTAAEPDGAPEPEGATGGGPGGRFIGPLARELGVRPATLRKWEAAGLVRPRRGRPAGWSRWRPPSAPGGPGCRPADGPCWRGPRSWRRTSGRLSSNEQTGLRPRTSPRARWMSAPAHRRVPELPCGPEAASSAVRGKA